MGDRRVAVAHRSAAQQQIPKIAIAFIAGMVGAIGGALIYSNIQQKIALNSQPATAQQSSRPSDTAYPGPQVAAAVAPPAPVGTQEDQPVPDAAVNTARATDQSMPATLPLGTPRSRSLQVANTPPGASRTGRRDGREVGGPVRQAGADAGRPDSSNSAGATPLDQYSTLDKQASMPSRAAVMRSESPNQAPPASKPVTLDAGSMIPVRMAEAVSSSVNNRGDTFTATLATPLIADGIMIAAKDSTVIGVVSGLRKGHVLHGRPQLRLALTNLKLADGKMVRIETALVEEDGSHSNLVGAAKSATGAAVGAVVGAVKGAAQGMRLKSSYEDRELVPKKRNLVIPEGTTVQFTLAAPLVAADPSQRR